MEAPKEMRETGETTPLTDAVVEDSEPAAPVSDTLALAFHACLCGGFLGLGIVLCMLGPTLLDLGDQTGATVQEMSLVFTCRSGAYLLGSVLGGVLLEKLDNTCAMLAAAMYLVAIGSFGIPLCTHVWSMGARPPRTKALHDATHC